MKKIFAVLLAGTLAVSLAACSGSNESSEADSSAASTVSSSSETDSSTESSAKESSSETTEKSDEESGSLNDVVEKLQKSVGEKSSAALEKLKGDQLTLNVAIKATSNDEETGKPKTQEIALQLIKNGENESRFTIGLGLMSIDILKNEEGTFMINNNTKKAAKMSSDQSSGMSTDSIMGSMSGMLGGDSGINTESAIDDLKNGDVSENIKFEGSAEEDYEGEKLTAETYTLIGKDTDGKDTTATLKVWFDGDDIKYITASSEDKSITAEFTKLTNEVDESLLVVPENYEITETSTVTSE